MSKISIGSIAKNISVVVGVVLIWRGIWLAMDAIDMALFNGNHLITAGGGILLGLLILYLPDHDLKELGRL